MIKAILMIFLLMISASLVAPAQTKSTPRAKGVLLENLTWVEAEKILKPDTVVVIPLGAAAKEHGPHLKLKNDFLISEYLKNQTLQKADVVIAPTINYHFYPAFVEYPGSTTLRMETARDLVIDICKSLSRYGARRFYILNTGISTLRALKPAAEALTADGILMHYTDLQKAIGAVEKEISKQQGGTHADEIETSMMLYIAPDSVDMKKAVKDYHPSKGRLTRDPNNKEGTYSATGIWGDPTLATKEKGRKIIEAYVAGILKDIEELRRANLASPSSKQN
jgi:creatinine amidohydrolase